ncbi:MAG: helix-turn-helix domain-containing protein [Solirubrobacteraceae bacterium]
MSELGAPTGRVVSATEARLLTADQLAARWQVPKSHVYRLAREQVIPVVKLGRYTRFRMDSIERWEIAQGREADA